MIELGRTSWLVRAGRNRAPIYGVTARHVGPIVSPNKRLLDSDDFARGAGYEQAYDSLGNPWKQSFGMNFEGRGYHLPYVTVSTSETLGIIRVSRRGEAKRSEVRRSERRRSLRERWFTGGNGTARCCFGNKRFVTVNSYEYVLCHRLWDVTLSLKLDRRRRDIRRNVRRLLDVLISFQLRAHVYIVRAYKRAA